MKLLLVRRQGSSWAARMATKALKTNPLVASGRLGLLLLVTVAMVVLQHTGAFTSSACGAEYDACYTDEECLECLQARSSSDTNSDGETVLDCIQDLEDDPDDICSLISATVCCYAASPNDCLGNSAFVEYMQCTAADQAGCTTLACDGVSGGIGGTSGVGSSSFPSAMSDGLAFLTTVALTMFVVAA